MTDIYSQITIALQANADPSRAKLSLRYFPIQEGQTGDKFYGGNVPSTRQVAKQFASADDLTLTQLLTASYHEQRLCGLMIMRLQLDKALKTHDDDTVQNIKNLYKDNLDGVNHWDLVDESASSILGRILVYEAINFSNLAKFMAIPSYQDRANGFPTLDHLMFGSLWHKRISVISQFAFIKAGNLSVPLSVIQMHIDNSHHYIQKACGWVLREIGKNDKNLLDQFLIKNIKIIHSTCLSYALEKHSQEQKEYIRSLRN
jgi:3-methyladenine DNA glycosylase AlkD